MTKHIFLAGNADNCLIKICGIRTPELAQAAATAGADFIGLIFHPTSPRAVTIDVASEIAAVAQRYNITPVAVFVEQDASEIQAICKAINVRTVQLHGDIPRAQHYLLPNNYQRIYVKHLSTAGEFIVDPAMHQLDPQRDFILLDHPQSGHGITVTRPAVLPQKFTPFRWLLAGGLTPENVVAAIATWQPDGVDVSSGVESARGVKDIKLMQQFINNIRNNARK